MEKSKSSAARKITESAVMIALATVLSLIKVVDLPYGGSITLASMLPVMIIAYRHGVVWGLFTGLTHGAIQLVIGIISSSILSYATGPAAAAAIIIFDYLLAFALIGIAGIFRGIKNERAAFIAGTVISCVLRYACHVISGATVWAGLSVPDSAALSYSIIYNATYMIPETLVMAIAAFYVALALDFRTPTISAAKKSDRRGVGVGVKNTVCIGVLAAAVIFDIALIFKNLQGEDGTFDVTGISSVNWILLAKITGIAVVVAIAFSAAAHFNKFAAKIDEETPKRK